MADVILTDEALEWYQGLDEADQALMDKAIGRLEIFGLKLGHPHCSDIKSSKHGLRELRVGGSPLRAFYAFDPDRDAVVIHGGDKSGNERRWYAENVARADKIWEQYLREREEEKKRK